MGEWVENINVEGGNEDSSDDVEDTISPEKSKIKTEEYDFKHEEIFSETSWNSDPTISISFRRTRS